MASFPLKKEAVSLHPSDNIEAAEWASPGKGNRGVYTRRFLLTINGQGGRTNYISAAVLGFAKLLGCSNGYDGGTGVVHRAAIDPVKNIVIVGDPIIGDIVALNFYITVEGIPN